MTTEIVNGIVEFVEVLQDSTHDYRIKVNATNGSLKYFLTNGVFTVGDFVSYEIKDIACINYAAFSDEHKIKLLAAYQNARTLHQRAQDAEQAFQLYDKEDDIRRDCASSKDAVNAVSGSITAFLGLPTIVAGVATANPLMMMAGAGMLGGTACAIKDTADNDAEKKLRWNRLQAKRQEAQEALAQSKRADEALDMLFSRFRKEALQETAKA